MSDLILKQTIMKRSLFIGGMFLIGLNMNGQSPDLVIKKELSSSLITTPRTFVEANGVDTIMLPLNHKGDFTLEVTAQVNSADGRGLDIETRKQDGTGFRTSVSPSKIYWANPISNLKSLSFSTNAEQTLRYAVKGNNVYVYQNGVYIFSKTLEPLNDIVNDKEVTPEATYVAENLISNWAGPKGTGSGAPTAYGWDSNLGKIPWNTANAGGGVRYMDVNSNSSPKHILDADNSTYNGRVLMLRWDNNDYASDVITYPVTLSANISYRFSYLFELWANASEGNMTVSISKDKEGKNIIASKTSYSSVANRLYLNSLDFTSEEAGEYYLLFSGSYALFGIAELSLNQFAISNHIIIGKNYTSGAVDMKVSNVKLDKGGAYAPELTNTVLDIVIENEVLVMESVTNKNITMKDGAELYLTSETPLINSTINMVSSESWLYFNNIKPSNVTGAKWFSNVTMNGAATKNKTNARISNYVNGTAINGLGHLNANAAITVYTEPNFGGESRTFAASTYYKDLGKFDNNIKSFIVKKGYSVTFANNSDGTGYSRHYIADEEDLKVSSMPNGLEFVSFVRSFYWNWVGKKGWCGNDKNVLNITNVSWFYDWDAGTSSTIDTEYTPMRHNAGWAAWSTINGRNDASHVLGFNEPEREDQANISVQTAINQWPELFKSGLRIGSPAPSHTGVAWLSEFMKCADSLNYRVDFLAVHCYEGGQSPANWASRVLNFSNTYANRPVWITEMNNGANWTTEWWPDNQDEQFEKQRTELKAIFNALDASPVTERYAFYNWVQDKRACEIGGKLTPAGEMFAEHKSVKAFNRAKEYVHTWKIAPPWITSASQSTDYKKFNMSWYDHNGETGLYYTVERKIGTGSYAVIDTLYAGKDYSYGGTVNYSTPTPSATAQYRVRARSYKYTNSAYSRIRTLTLDAAIAAPKNLTAEAMGTSIVELKWDAVAGAKFYTLKRSLTEDGPYTNVRSNFTDNFYTDKSLKEKTTYYYKVSASNNRGETEDSEVISVETKLLVKPENITGLTVSAGDAKVSFTWDHMYDTKFRIYRADLNTEEFFIYAEDITSNRYVNSLLKNGETYYYKIEAYNALGNYIYPEIFKVTPRSGQHAYFSFDENEETLARDSWGAYNGTLFNNVEWAEGKHDSGISLSSGRRSHLQLAPGIVSDLSAFTISTWVNFTMANANSRIFDFGNSETSYMMLSPKVGNNIRYTITTGSAIFIAETPYTFNTGEWAYVTITQSGTAFKIFINGEEKFSTNTATVKPSDLGETALNYLGRSQSSTDAYSTFLMDEFRIYNKALSAAEIVSIMEESVYSLSMSSRTKKMDAGNTESLNVTIFPDNASNKNIIWTSSDPAIASVDKNGLVYAKTEGTATITATSEQGEKTATCRVTVSGNIEMGIDDMSLDVNVYIHNNNLYVNTPVQEVVTVFTTAGQQIARKEKQADLDMLELPIAIKQILIIKGNSGWVKKIVY